MGILVAVKRMNEEKMEEKVRAARANATTLIHSYIDTLIHSYIAINADSPMCLWPTVTRACVP